MKESTKHKIKVIARFRPLIKRELKSNASSVWNIDEELASIRANKNAKKSKRASATPNQTFVFDQVHDESSSTVEVYNSSVKKIVENFCNGYNGTILAYGQTSSGKTYRKINENKIIKIYVLYFFVIFYYYSVLYHVWLKK